MKSKMESFEILVPNLDGTEVERKLTVKVPLVWDEEFGQWVMSEEAHQIIDDAKAQAMGLLLPAQLKELRERFGFTQKEMGELFQVGEKSWTRWESGKHRASRVINLLIRALYEEEISINYLCHLAGKPAVSHESVWVKLMAKKWSEISTSTAFLETERDIGKAVQRGFAERDKLQFSAAAKTRQLSDWLADSESQSEHAWASRSACLFMSAVS